MAFAPPSPDRPITLRMGDEEDKAKLKKQNPNLNHLIWEGGYLILAEECGRLIGYLWAFKREIPAPVEAS